MHIFNCDRKLYIYAFSFSQTYHNLCICMFTLISKYVHICNMYLLIGHILSDIENIS